MTARSDVASTDVPAVTGPVGFIGLGNIGAPMAKRLLAWPDGLIVCDAVPAAVEPFVARGAVAAATAAEVSASASVISIMVNTEDQVRSVLFGPGGIAEGVASSERERTIVAVHSTISDTGARELGALAAEEGIALIDAPVSGGAIGAAEGTLAIMAGGDRSAIDACRPVFAHFASLVKRFGDTGAGTQAKIVRNLITFASFCAVGEAQRIAEAAGLNLGALGDVVRHSDRVTGGAGAIMLRQTAEAMAADDPLRPIFAHTAALGTKDLELAATMARSLGVDSPFAALSMDRLARALGLEDG